MVSLHKFKDYLRLREAAKKAEQALLNTGQRHYVLPSNGVNLIVVDRKDFRRLKQKHYISQKATVNDMIAESFYFTSYANGIGLLSPDYRKHKQNNYYAYCRAIRKKEAYRKKEARKKKLKAFKKKLIKFFHLGFFS